MYALFHGLENNVPSSHRATNKVKLVQIPSGKNRCDILGNLEVKCERRFNKEVNR